MWLLCMLTSKLMNLLRRVCVKMPVHLESENDLLPLRKLQALDFLKMMDRKSDNKKWMKV